MKGIISVILPYYNSEDTIRRCIESVLDQTYVHFELIAVSDGSTDGSSEMVRRFSLMDSRVVPLEIPHGGVSRARNAGLDYASGDYIDFVDADDFLEPTMFERLLGVLQTSGADMCVCDYTHPCLHNYGGDQRFDFRRTADQLAYYQNAFAAQVPWNKLCRREMITERFPEGMAFCEDEMFCLANMFNARSVVNISDRLYHYYVAPPAAGKKTAISSLTGKPFWESEDSIWFKRMKLIGFTRELLKGRVSVPEREAFLYARIFDFLLWGLALYCSAGADPEGIRCETERIMKHPEFLHSLAIKKPLGIRLQALSDEERHIRVQRLVDGALTFYKAYGDGGEEMRPYYVYLALFCRLFMEKTDDFSADSRDPIVAMIVHLDAGDTNEGRYADTLLSGKGTASLQTA